MRHKNRIIVFFCFFCLAGFLFQGCSKPAGRNEYPVNDITVICPWVQGGGTDMVLRALCESAESRLGVKINIVNRAGENGALGFEAIRDASTDGYTIGMITYELNSLPRENLLDFTYQDIEPLVMVNADAVALAANIDAPYNDVKELVEYARANPGRVDVAQATTGSVWHVGAALFVDMADIEVNFLPFEGTANAVTAAANGYTEVVASSVAEAKEQVDAGKLKFLGIMDTERPKLYPKVQTFIEQGYDITYYTWRGIALPKGVDEEKRKVLEEAFSEAMKDKHFIEAMDRQNLNITYLDSQGFRDFLKKNYDEVGKALKTVNLLKE